MTVLDLIKSSLRLINALASGETPDANSANDARTALNVMLDSWHNEGLLTLMEEQSFSVVSGTSVYSIGAGQTWAGNKPLKIDTAVLLDVHQKEYGLTEYRYSDFMRLYDKQQQGIPSVFAYKPGNATGVFYLHDTPNQSFTIKLLSHQAFTAYTDLNTEVVLPSGFEKALKYNLAVELIPEYGTDVNQLVFEQAKNSLIAIKKTNLKKAPVLQYPGGFGKHRYFDAENNRVI